MEECILKNKNKLCPYKKLSVFYNTCLKTFGSHLVFPCKYIMYTNAIGKGLSPFQTACDVLNLRFCLKIAYDQN